MSLSQGDRYLLRALMGITGAVVGGAVILIAAPTITLGVAATALVVAAAGVYLGAGVVSPLMEQFYDGTFFDPGSYLQHVWDAFAGGRAYGDTPPGKFEKAGEESLLSDPLLLDLNGDGIKTTDLSPGVFLDHDNNGFAELTSWVDANDGVLVVDKNGNGIIENGNEVFGNNSILANGQIAADGYASLADYDTNHDGVVNSSDANFSDIKVLKGDGTLLTLQQADIASLNLAHTATNTIDANGNIQVSLGSFTKIDNTTGQMGDYNLQTASDVSLPLKFVQVSVEAAALPQVLGTGNVYNLQEAMTLDTSGTLLGLVTDFVNATTTSAQNTLLDQILVQWTGMSMSTASTRGGQMYDSHAAIMEAFMGRTFHDDNDTNFIGTLPAGDLSQGYYALAENLYGELMAHTQLQSYFALSIWTFDEETQDVSLDLQGATDALVSLASTDRSEAILKASQFSRVLQGLGYIPASNYSDFYQTMAGLGSDFQFAIDTIDKVSVLGTSGNDTLGTTGTGAWDTGSGYATQDSRALYVNAGAGNDLIKGTYNNDYFVGGAGNDTIIGNAGNDTYLFNVGDGQDTIQEGNVFFEGNIPFNADLGNDNIILGSGIAVSDVTFSTSGTDIIMSIADGHSGQITIEGGANDNGDMNIENIIFADGTVLDYEHLMATATIGGSSGADTITGTALGDLISSGDGNDTISSASGSDSVNAGNGNDNIQAGFGHDTVLAGAGDDSVLGQDGNDSLLGQDGLDTLDSGNGNDILDGGAGNDYLYGNIGNDSLLGGADNDTLYDNDGNNTLDGGSGNDLITASTGAGTYNSLIGGTGNDTLSGSVGNEIYVFNIGDGQDTLSDSGGTDTIQFGTGITSANLLFAANGNNLVITRPGSTDSITVSNYFSSPNNQIEKFTFADASSLTSVQVALLLQVQGTSSDDAYLQGTEQGESILGYAGNDYVYAAGGNDTVYGGDGNDSLYGVSGNDLLYGEAGNDVLSGDTENDTLTGGIGNDTLQGGSGNDTYVFVSGDGQDTVSDYSGTDTIKLGTGYTAATTVFTADQYNHLFITHIGSSDSIKVTDFYSSSSPSAVSQIIFADNTTLTRAQITALLQTQGTSGADTLSGSSQGESIFGYDGTDSLSGWDGNDTLYGGNANDTLDGGSGNDSLFGDAGNDSLQGSDGDDTLYGGTGTDTLAGGFGNDFYTIDSATTTIIEYGSPGIDTVSSSISYNLGTGSNVENLILTGSGNLTGMGNELDNVLTGNSGNNSLTGSSGNDTLNGGAGTDTLIGGTGNDVYIVDSTTDTITENSAEGTDTVQSSVTYTLGSNLENLTLTGSANLNGTGNTLDNVLIGNAGNNSLSASSGTDTLDGGAGTDTLVGGTGNDTYIVDSTTDTITENSSEGTDIVQSSVTYTLGSNLENLTLTGSTAINGTGNTLNNVLTGNSADNSLDGGTGTDTLIGGLGNDTYTVDSTTDTITENSAEGTDTVLSSVTYTLGSNLENLALTGSTAINGTGNTLDNVLTGNSGNNSLTGSGGNDTLNGGAGTDTLVGGTGNDVYSVDSTTDTITENSAEGTDTVQSSVTYTLGSNVENLTLTGSTAINGTGNTLDNVLTGNSGNNSLSASSGNDTLDGGVGNDTLVGGAGNDTYYVDSTSDVITENASEGTDVVFSTASSYTLSTNVENLTLSGTGNINGTGNSLNNVLTGNAGNNTLDGGTGTDTLIGGLGDDTYAVDSTTDTITENANEGSDTILSSISWTLSTANVENVSLSGSTAINATGNTANNILTGNSGNNSLSGSGGNDTLNGGAGTDTLIGGTGDDTYVVDSTTDTITELSGEGTDTVQSSVNYTLGTNLENLTLTGASAITGTGNSANNVLTGNSGNNTLDGGTGTDTLAGGLGNDTYIVDSTTDTITENAAEGTDTVQSSVTYTLDGNLVAVGNLENLTLTGSADLFGTGNGADNVLTGNSGNNYLSGGAGTDTLNGGAGTSDSLIGGNGNDTYIVDTTTDYINEGAGGGIDTVQSSVTYTLGTELDNLTLTGSSTINGTGNTLNNALTGNSANNTLTGLAGNDTLDGGTGTDTLIGGTGDDTYIVDSTTDTITENANEGNDLVQSSVTYTLGTNLENLMLSGSANINGTGNSVDNTVTGNSGNNSLTGGAGNDTLKGGAGIDTMVGGTGNDSYTVDNASDVVTENSAEGTDTVYASVAQTLGSNVENLVLLETGGAINGTGNSLNNSLAGNNAANYLDAGSGNDTLYGGLGGNDSLIGGTGDDLFIVDHAGINVYEWSGEGTDTVQSSIDYTLGDDLEKLILTGSANLNGTGNNSDNVIEGNSGNNILDGSGGDDTLQGGLGDDTYYVQNYDDVVIESAYSGHDTVRAYFGYGLTDNVEDLILDDAANWSYGEGNALDNVLIGNTSHNDLYGGDGNDTLIGGEGDDSLYAGFGNDTYKFSVDDGTDVISENGGTTDTVLFDSSAALASIGLYQDSYGNLQLGYGSSGDTVTIQGQGTTDGNMERFQTSDGHYLTDSDVALVLQDMSSYATSHSISMTSLSDVQGNANLMAIVNGAWHAA